MYFLGLDCILRQRIKAVFFVLLKQLGYNIDIDRLKSGDVYVFRRFFDLLYPKLLSLGMRFVSEEVAEDMAQDVLTQYWEQKQSIDAVNLQSYLYKTLQNKCLNYLRHQEVAEKYSLHLSIAQARLEYMNTHKDENDIFKQITAKEFKQKVELELSQLSPRVALAFRLCFFEDMTHKEVAEAMEISVRSAETYIFDAISTLRNKLNREELFYLLLGLTLVN